MHSKTDVHTDDPSAEEVRGRILYLVPKKVVRFVEDYGILPYGAKPCPCGGVHQETDTSRIFAAERRLIRPYR